MPACCITYTTDDTYLFPTFVSAMQAHRHSSRKKADVAIFCIDLGETARRAFEPVCEAEGIRLISIKKSMIDGENAMLSRLFLDRFVPGEYSQILYMDGDVQIHDSLDPLIQANVPADRFLAANDPITFLLADSGLQSRNLAAHMAAIGLTAAQSLRYFNSGVLRINRKGWDSIGMRAWEQFKRMGRTSRFPDQDALNLVSLGNRLPMSLAWNFPVFLRNSRVAKQIQPRITHFMSSPKPWQGSFPPWNDQACVPYADALEQYPSLIPFRLNFPFHRRAFYHLHQNSKKFSEVFTWGWSKRRDRILNYETTCSLAAIPDHLHLEIESLA